MPPEALHDGPQHKPSELTVLGLGHHAVVAVREEEGRHLVLSPSALERAVGGKDFL